MLKKNDAIEQEKLKLANQLAGLSYGDEGWQEIMDAYIALDDHQIEKRKVDLLGAITPKDVFQALLTGGLAIATLNYEKENTLRSAVKSLWLKRPWK